MKGLKLAKICWVIALFLALVVYPIRGIFALTESNKYVRTANYFLKAGTDIPPDDYSKLAQFDLLVLPQEAQVYNKELFSYLRKNNPDIIILAYTPTRSVNIKHLNDFAGLRRKLIDNANIDWYLYDQWGGIVSTWTDTKSFNVVSGWNEYLPRFVSDNILSTGLWDGIFYDEVDADISYKNSGNIDLNRDGQKDSAGWADGEWRQGVVKLLQNTRNIIGSAKIIVINGNSHDAYQPYVNGRMFESFPTPWEGNGDWQASMSSYDKLQDKVGYPEIFIINSNTKNTGNQNDYRAVRFGLASALMNNGYFGFDYGDQDHGQIWLYDEYDVFLDAPASAAYNIDNKNDQSFQNGVWRRDFKKGTVVVNSGNQSREVKLGGEFEKIHGAQDSNINDGSIVSKVYLDGKDGIILLRPVDQITNAVFTNASFARIFNSEGQSVRNGFFAYESAFRGGQKIIVQDLDNDGHDDFVVASNNKVMVYNSDRTLRAEFYPYEKHFDKGVNIAVGDLDRDGVPEIITGTENGGGPHIRIFNRDGRLINPGFFAYGKEYRGGVNVAVGDLNGDGWNEIIAGAGVGGGPHVRVFNKGGKLINPGFFAYDPSFRGGVNVAVGDLNGDGRDEIITGPGYGGGPQVRVFNENGKMLSAGFFAFDTDVRSGVRVASSDVDGDGRDEIIALTTDVFTLTAYLRNY